MLLNRLRVDWKYALGEILLIAIGVLIALAVDGWRDYQAERKLEAEYIGRIENDLLSALDTWDSHTERLEQAIDFLEHMRADDLDYLSQDNAANVWNAYMVSHWFAPPAIRSSAFEELVSTGRLSIIEDIALRDSISNFYTEYSSVGEMSAQMVDHSYTHFSRSAVPYDVFHDAQILRDFDVAKIRKAFENLRSSPEFVELSNTQLTTHVGNIQFMKMYMGYANSLLEDIAKYDGQGGRATRDGN